jgi:hypothetical protein
MVHVYNRLRKVNVSERRVLNYFTVQDYYVYHPNLVKLK